MVVAFCYGYFFILLLIRSYDFEVTKLSEETSHFLSPFFYVLRVDPLLLFLRKMSNLFDEAVQLVHDSRVSDVS